MKKTFKEYHQFSEKEFKQLWKDCLFVFDTNTLLNMYRYSRETVEKYFEVLNQLKTQNQLWIPYQVGYEFYENRIDVIAEYESSYDSIVTILDKAKNDIDTKYKNHPFLDLADIKKQIDQGLSSVDKQIKEAKKKHPKWMDSDEVLNKINDLFENNIGGNYSEEKLEKIKKEGAERYEKRIPPGFKDDKKPENKKYGDLILWFQIIDKAIESKKPIILISGDVKEDWWLEKNGNRLAPLPQLKKEILDKAGVDFHIYTADRFLEHYTSGESTTIDRTTITEVRKIRELEEKRILSRRRIEIDEKESGFNHKMYGRYSIEYFHREFEIISDLIKLINQEEINSSYKDKLEHLFLNLKEFRNRIMHGRGDRVSYMRFREYYREHMFDLQKLIHSEELNPEVTIRVRELLERLDHLIHRIREFI